MAASGLASDEAAARSSYCICLVSDFCYPRLGGVEGHQYQLAQCLMRRGHRVVVVTGSYATDSGGSTGRQGVRYLTGGLKVYYCPQMSVVNQASLPTLYTFFPLLRQILLRERVDIVHVHQTTSALAHEAVLHGRTMGYPVVFTDHSLFGFANAAAIHLNKVMEFSLTDVSHVVCVSHTSRENLVLRALLDPRLVSVIPNAVDTERFVPAPERAPDPRDRINIVVLSRLVFRKGVDLLVRVIPAVCAAHPKVHFIIGGDGNKRLEVEEMRERHSLHDRVEMLGAVPHNEVRDVLVRGHLFVNFSLTEAFCIAILEAVSCGLYVVSTRVGGVPEVLPERMIRFAAPEPDALVRAVGEAVKVAATVDPWDYHAEVKRMYDWRSVARRTEVVYDRIVGRPREPLVRRLARFHRRGVWAGKLFCLVVAVDYLLWRLLEWLFPRGDIDAVPRFPRDRWRADAARLVASAPAIPLPGARAEASGAHAHAE